MSERCPRCECAMVRCLKEVRDGIGMYRCSDCTNTWVADSVFVELTDKEAAAVAELAFGDGNYNLEQEVSDRRKFAENVAGDIRLLTGRALEQGADAQLDEPSVVQDLHDRLTDLMFP